MATRCPSSTKVTVHAAFPHIFQLLSRLCCLLLVVGVVVVVVVVVCAPSVTVCHGVFVCVSICARVRACVYI